MPTQSLARIFSTVAKSFLICAWPQSRSICIRVCSTDALSDFAAGLAGLGAAPDWANAENDPVTTRVATSKCFIVGTIIHRGGIGDRGIGGLKSLAGADPAPYNDISDLEQVAQAQVAQGHAVR